MNSSAIAKDTDAARQKAVSFMLDYLVLVESRLSIELKYSALVLTILTIFLCLCVISPRCYTAKTFNSRGSLGMKQTGSQVVGIYSD